MKVLITGASGFIGSHVVEAVANAGYDVVAFVRYNGRGDIGWLNDAYCADIVAGDIRDSDRVRAAMKDCEAVLHLAALISIPYSYRSPRAYVETNVTGTLNVLEAAGPRTVIVTSTSEVYGTAVTVPMSEGHRLHAQSPYAASKIASDQLALSWRRSFGTVVIVVRPFNAFGPRQSPRAVIPSIVRQALAGSEIRVGNTAAARDWTYVTDVAKGFVAALDGGVNTFGEVVNLGTGRAFSVDHVIGMVGRMVGRDLMVVQDEARIRPRESEVDRLVADATKAGVMLGWRPAVPFEQGLAETVEWWRGRGAAEWEWE